VRCTLSRDYRSALLALRVAVVRAALRSATGVWRATPVALIRPGYPAVAGGGDAFKAESGCGVQNPRVGAPVCPTRGRRVGLWLCPTGTDSMRRSPERVAACCAPVYCSDYSPRTGRAQLAPVAFHCRSIGLASTF